MDRRPLPLGQMFPDLLRGERDHRCGQTHYNIQDLVHGGLSRAPGRGMFRIAIDPIFTGIDVKRAELHGEKPV